jgi:hypothetical protein
VKQGPRQLGCSASRPLLRHFAGSPLKAEVDKRQIANVCCQRGRMHPKLAKHGSRKLGTLRRFPRTFRLLTAFPSTNLAAIGIAG